MGTTNVKGRGGSLPRVVLPLLAGLLVGAGCKELCYERLEPDGTADFSSLRLDGRLLCNHAGTCQGTFSADMMELAFLTEPSASISYRDVMRYSVSYQGTHEQTQSVTVQYADLETCGQYRRETWTVPTVTMSLLSATRDGQPLTLGPPPGQLDPAHQSLTVVTHYVDRVAGDEYVGVLLRATQPRVDSYALEIPLTKNGNGFHFRENP